MTREHLINTILSAVFPAGSIPVAAAYKVPRILTLVGELADEVGFNESLPEPPTRSETGIDWDNEPRLGTMSDEGLAYALGVSRKTVTRERKRRSLKFTRTPAGLGKRLGIDWDNEPRLGVMGDTDLARELGCSAATVLTARRNRGLPSPTKPGRRRATELEEVGFNESPLQPPEPVAPVVPVTTTAATKPLTEHRPQGGRQGTDWSQVTDFWTASTTSLAARYGVSQSAVYKARNYLRSRAVTPERQAEVEAAPAVVSILERTAPPPSVDRQRELDTIEEHIKAKGVTKVKTRYVEPDSIPANPKGRGGLV